MKRKGRKSASKKDDSAENGVEEKVAENGDSSQDNEEDYEPAEKKRGPKRKGGPVSSEKDRENGDARDDEANDEEEHSPERKKKGRGKSHHKEASDYDEEDEREPEPERKKSKKKVAKNRDPEESDDEDQEKSKKKSTKRKSSSKKKDEEEEDESKDDDYEVEAILDDKIIRGVRHFLIRWKGYEPESDTWEPESTLDCPDLIADYKSKPKKKKDKKKKTSETTWDENDDFEVDRILEVHFKKNGRREFLVSWKGYPASDNSWEPEENMDCKDLIERFMAKVERAKESDTRELRANRATTDRFTLTMYEGAGRRASKRNMGKQRVHYYDAE